MKTLAATRVATVTRFVPRFFSSVLTTKITPVLRYLDFIIVGIFFVLVKIYLFSIKKS